MVGAADPSLLHVADDPAEVIQIIIDAHRQPDFPTVTRRRDLTDRPTD